MEVTTILIDWFIQIAPVIIILIIIINTIKSGLNWIKDFIQK